MGPLAQEDIRRFVLGGKSTFTVQNKDTGNRFTYRVKFASDKKDPLYFVGLLSGPDNSHDYSYIGIIHRDAFRRTGKSEVTANAKSFQAFSWLWGKIHRKERLPKQVEVYHEGRCGRCGRKLTVPTSIASGFGPDCVNRV
jgi:hypothetical protein